MTAALRRWCVEMFSERDLCLTRCRKRKRWRGAAEFDPLLSRGKRVLDLCFFFSSRRRHTRFDCDWSSDVCSSDLESKGLRKGLIVNLDSTVSSIRRAVEEAEGVANVPVEEALIGVAGNHVRGVNSRGGITLGQRPRDRSEEHTSELQSPSKLVCRPLLGKKKSC